MPRQRVVDRVELLEGRVKVLETDLQKAIKQHLLFVDIILDLVNRLQRIAKVKPDIHDGWITNSTLKAITKDDLHDDLLERLIRESAKYD